MAIGAGNVCSASRTPIVQQYVRTAGPTMGASERRMEEVTYVHMYRDPKSYT